MTIADTLNRAADQIEEDGWWPGWGREPMRSPSSNSVCAVQAIYRLGVTDRDEALLFFRHYVKTEPGVACLEDIFDWNDAQPDAETVIATLRAAAVVAAAQEGTYAGDPRIELRAVGNSLRG